MEHSELVFKTMKEAERPLRAGEIAELSGMEKGQVDRAMKELKKQELIFSPKKCFWQAK